MTKKMGLVIGVFILIGIVLLLSIKITKKDHETSALPCPESVLYSTHIYLSCLSEGKVIDNGLFNRYLFLNKLLDEPILVVDYSEMGCNSCIKFVLDGLSSTMGNLQDNRKILFVISESYNAFEEISGNSIFLPKDETLGIEVERNHYPLLFVYYHGIRHFYMPDPDSPEVYQLYLKTIQQRYNIE